MAITPSLLPGMLSKSVIDEGIAKANAAGVYRGRKPLVDVEAVKALKVSGKEPAEVAKELGIGRTSVYRGVGGMSRYSPQVHAFLIFFNLFSIDNINGMDSLSRCYRW